MSSLPMDYPSDQWVHTESKLPEGWLQAPGGYFLPGKLSGVADSMEKRQKETRLNTPPADLTIPLGMRHCELPTGDYPLEFWGRFVREEDTDTGESKRWAHLLLYAIIDTNPEHDTSLPETDENYGMYGKEMYLLYTIGHTLVYHDEDATCRGGVRVKVADFPRKNIDFPSSDEDPDLEPCDACTPRDYRIASEDEFFKLEVTWYSYTPCQTADKLIRSLYRDPRCETCRHKPHENRRCPCRCANYREAPRTLSTPGRNLLEGARDTEPEIAKAMGMKKRL